MQYEGIVDGCLYIYNIWVSPAGPRARPRAGQPPGAWRGPGPGPGPGRGPGPGPETSLSAADLKKKPPGKNNIPYILKCVVSRVLVTFYGIQQIWHPQHK